MLRDNWMREQWASAEEHRFVGVVAPAVLIDGVIKQSTVNDAH